MKEVKKWDGRPRTMWCWNEQECQKTKALVFDIKENRDMVYPVFSAVYDRYSDEVVVESYMHCAEVGVRRKMTNKELARWLREKQDREYKDCINKTAGISIVSGNFTYTDGSEDEECSDSICIREGDGPWYEPFTEDE